MTVTRKPRLVSMFSGCGGLDLGFEQAGYDIVHVQTEEALVSN